MSRCKTSDRAWPRNSQGPTRRAVAKSASSPRTNSACPRTQSLTARKTTRRTCRTTRNVILFTAGIKIENFCVYCCMNEFGSESRSDREVCLKACLGVNYYQLSNFSLKTSKPHRLGSGTKCHKALSRNSELTLIIL